jgi:formylglycine-generating enzyme required for sulfatase activity/dienelactone hydrolase
MAAPNQPKFSVRAYHGKDPFCFISYSHDDSVLIFDELERLDQSGFRFYYDEGIHPAHTWHDELAGAIENCDLFIFFVSSNSVASSNCQREINFALDREKPVLAIHIEDVDLSAGLQLALGDRQAIIKSRFEEDDYRQRIYDSISNYVTPIDGGEINQQRAPSVTDGKNRWPLMISVALVIVLSLAGSGYYFYSQAEEKESERYQAALEEVESLLNKDRFSDAYLLIKDLDPMQDPRRSEYAERIVVPGTIAIANEGVSVSFKPYGRDDVDWIPLGLTPFQSPTPLPRGELHFKLELEGHDAQEIVAKNPGPMFGNGFYLENIGRGRFTQEPIRLVPVGQIPGGWVAIPKSDQPFFLTGWSRDVFGMDLIEETSGFYVSKFEVSNSEYKEFVSAGGYTNPEYWQGQEFVGEGGSLTFEEAMTSFVDKTGRPGPSTWELSSYGEGEADLPVTGVSWHEAAAYARFRGLSLPTIYQWARFALGPIEGIYPLAGVIEQQSNFSQERLVPVQSTLGLGPWGTYNSAGNVREWVWNQAGDLGLIQGSQWQSYGNYSQAITAPRMNRHETNGIRLVQNLASEPFNERLLAPIDLLYDDPFVSREPVSDEAFEVMRFQFTAPKREPLEVQVERVEETQLWTADEHSLKFSESETFVIYLFKPTSGQPPYQTIVYGPPANAARPGQLNREAIPGQAANFSYILRSGRAVALPIWAATYERVLPRSSAGAGERSNRHRMGALAWHRDIVDTMDYIETLDDIRSDGVAYMGYSFGAAWYGQLVVALENRLSNAIFVSGGLVHTSQLNPMLDSINWAPRITVPVLQLNGIYDHIFPWEESAKRHFQLLGTPEEHKKLVGYDAGHIGFPENQMVAEIADWLDKYLGPVNQSQ